jgi:hypothetical protein
MDKIAVLNGLICPEKLFLDVFNLLPTAAFCNQKV